MRRFKIMTKSEPSRLQGEGVLFFGGRVAVLDYRHELVFTFTSLELALRDHQSGITVEWLDGDPEAGS